MRILIRANDFSDSFGKVMPMGPLFEAHQNVGTASRFIGRSAKAGGREQGKRGNNKKGSQP